MIRSLSSVASQGKVQPAETHIFHPFGLSSAKEFSFIELEIVYTESQVAPEYKNQWKSLDPIEW